MLLPPSSSPRTSTRTTFLLLAVLLLPAAAWADIQITLKNTFIAKFKNRATIDAAFTVDKAHAHPNPPSKDGDLHAAGRAPEIGLASVAEVMNAASQDSALDAIHRAESSHDSLKVNGFWRLWCEHGGDSVHVQGQALKPFPTTNPDHIFEIHPLLTVGDVDVHRSLQPIQGFTYKDATDAFHSYERLSSHIVPGNGVTTITTRMAGYNYVEFLLQLNEDPTFRLQDGGLAVKAGVFTLDQELLVRERRMIFAAGTVPFDRVQGLHKGDMLHVVGVPRIDLALVAWRVANRTKRPGVLDWSLPYEMAIVATFDDSPTPNEDNALPEAPPPPPPAPATPPSSGPPPAHAADPMEVLAHLLTKANTGDPAAGACTFTAASRSYCAVVRQSDCNLLGGAWAAGRPCS